MALEHERDVAAQLAREAGQLALQVRAAGLNTQEKPDGAGPVTDADRAADAYIRQGLGRHFPQDALLTEETPDDGAWRKAQRVWMVDPVDGTKEFVRGGTDFACMVGLCVDGQPAVGAVYRPMEDVLYAAATGLGTTRTDRTGTTTLMVSDHVPDPLVVAVSKSHRSKRLDVILAALGPLTPLPSGSVGLKIALIAEGKAGAYLNAASRACLWDSCAPCIILEQAGGLMTDLAGRPLSWVGGLEHRNGLFCATRAVHQHLRARVVATARQVAASLAAQESYPRDAFVWPEGLA